MNQNERLISYLKSGKRISPLISWRELGIYRLAARINEIQDQIDIQRGWIDVENQHGETIKVREYWSE